MVYRVHVRDSFHVEGLVQHCVHRDAIFGRCVGNANTGKEHRASLQAVQFEIEQPKSTKHNPRSSPICMPYCTLDYGAHVTLCQGTEW